MMHRSALTRRQALVAGSVGLCGLDLARLSQLRANVAPRAKSCVFLFLFGGPSHIDLWDMKPQAPAEIRGEFRSIATSTPGIPLCEHLPLLARQTHHLCLLRSMTHKMPVHGPACSEITTGREYFGPPVTDQATPEDWPSLSALVTRYGQSPAGLPPAVVLPWYAQFVGQDKRIAGQTGGRMGNEFNPFLMEGDPTRPDFRVQGLELPPDVSSTRFDRRRKLRTELTRLERIADGTALGDLSDRHYAAAFTTIERASSAGAFDLQREPQAQRDAYGPSKFGQSLLAARRLVEAGIPLVTVNWDDDSRSDKVSPHWDTHHNNFARLKDNLCPPFDRALSTFLADLDQCGLLESTLVVASGEFGRTPRIGLITQNGMTEATGRDHWPHAFTVLLAGGGVRGGQIYGSTNRHGAFVEDKPVTPADLSATVLSHLGIDPAREYHDQFQRVSRRLSEGRVVRGLG